jgi:hypothetical protein
VDTRRAAPGAQFLARPELANFMRGSLEAGRRRAAHAVLVLVDRFCAVTRNVKPGCKLVSGQHKCAACFEWQRRLCRPKNDVFGNLNRGAEEIDEE